VSTRLFSLAHRRWRIAVPAKLKITRVDEPTDSDVIPPLVQVCMVVGDHHYCFGIFAN